MRSTLKQKLISKITKILKIKSEKQLLKIKRRNHEDWDSLIHLNIIFLLEKNTKKKFSIDKLNQISNGRDIIKIIDEN
jgi:acyl carrier protein